MKKLNVTHLTLCVCVYVCQYGGCTGTLGVCLSEDEFLLLLHFQLLMKTSSAFQPVS